jgi:hypothetical protein
VLSVAYQWGGYSRPTENEYEKVKAENDWTAELRAVATNVAPYLRP